MFKLMICGIGTGVGKTIASAILVQMLGADYWKPIQCGELEASDTSRVRSLVSLRRPVFHPEAYQLAYPASPLQAASRQSIAIDPKKICLPHTDRSLIIESAGGLMVPLTNDLLLSDILIKFSCEWILVSKHYLGSINHTLLSVQFLKTRRVPIRGIIFNGTPIPGTEEYILHQTKLPCIGCIREEARLNKTIIKEYALEWKPHFHKEIARFSGTPSPR